MGREDKNINKRNPHSGLRLQGTFYLSALILFLLIGCSGFSPELLTGGNERERIVEEILARGRIYSVRAGDEAVLISLLDDPNQNVRLAALKIMEANPSPLIYDAVLKATLDESDAVTDEAYRILLDHWDDSRFAVLRGLNASSASVILASINAIGRKESSEDAPYLLTLFSDPRNVVRSSASRTYARLGTYEDLWFQGMLEHSNSVIRLTAVETIPRFQNPALVPSIIAYIRDEDPQVRKAALFGLSEFGTEALPFLHETLRFSGDDELRSGILQIVEGISDTSSVPVLIRLMDDKNQKIALKSVEILLGMGADTVVPVLIERLDLMEKSALTQSFILSGRFKDLRMVPVLVSYFKNEDQELAEAAINAVRSYGDAASSYLLTQLAAEDPIRSISLELLVDFREPRLVYRSEDGEYRTDNIFLFFEEIPQESVFAYFQDIDLPSRVITALWSLYDIETTTDKYRKSKQSARRETLPYFYYFREWEQYMLSSEASRTSSFSYMQDFFETNDEKSLAESRMLRESSDWYENGADRSFGRAINAGRQASDEEMDVLKTYLESREALVNRWRSLTSDIQGLARLIFLRYSLDIETLEEEYDFFRSMPRDEIPAPEDF